MFRTEALQAQRRARYGDVLLVGSGRAANVTTVAAVIVAGAIMTYLALGTVTRKAQVTGFVAPAAGLSKAVAQQAGIVVRRPVNEGARVEQGDVLFILSSDRASSAGDTGLEVSNLLQGRRGSILGEIEQRAAHAKRQLDLLARRNGELVRDIKGLGDQIAMQEQRVAMAKESANRFRDLRESNFVSPAQHADRQAEVIDQSQRLADMRRTRGALQRELIAARSEAVDLETQLQLDKAMREREMAALSQDIAENEARREILVRAASAGVLSDVLADIGQPVQTGQVLGTVIPKASEMEAHLLVPSRAVGFLKHGQQVWLRLHAFPYQKFGQLAGVVSHVPGSPVKPEDFGTSAVIPMTAGEAVYRVKVRLHDAFIRAYGQAQPLRTGMSLDATVVLEKRRLYEWILDPVYSVTGRLP